MRFTKEEKGGAEEGLLIGVQETYSSRGRKRIPCSPAKRSIRRPGREKEKGGKRLFLTVWNEKTYEKHGPGKGGEKRPRGRGVYALS